MPWQTGSVLSPEGKTPLQSNSHKVIETVYDSDGFKLKQPAKLNTHVEMSYEATFHEKYEDNNVHNIIAEIKLHIATGLHYVSLENLKRW